MSTFTQTACAPGSGGKSACVTTPACGSWTATDAPTTTSTDSPAPSDTAATVSLAIYHDKGCNDLIDKFEIPVDTKCAVHLKNDHNTQKFKCIVVTGVNHGASDEQLELVVYKHGDCRVKNDDDRKAYTDLDAIIDRGQTPFKMGAVGLSPGGA